MLQVWPSRIFFSFFWKKNIIEDLLCEQMTKKKSKLLCKTTKGKESSLYWMTFRKQFNIIILPSCKKSHFSSITKSGEPPTGTQLRDFYCPVPTFQEAFDNVWRHLWLSQPGEYSWHPLGKGQGAVKHPIIHRTTLANSKKKKKKKSSPKCQ